MTLNELIQQRYGQPPATNPDGAVTVNDTLAAILSRRSHRRFRDRPVDDALLDTLFATAFAAPSKSDLQQACVIRVSDRAKQQRIAQLAPSIGWIAEAPAFMVWCGDSRRIRRLADWRRHPFANDHLDAFMNAAVDAGIAMQTFIIAAESVGLGCCPVSEVRNNIEPLSAELDLPDWVFPVAGLCLGWPPDEGELSLRLPLSLTVHDNTYSDDGLFEQVAAYDRARERRNPTPPEQQRLVERFGVAEDYGWSENRTRQYAVPARDNFGRYIRRQKFNLS